MAAERHVGGGLPVFLGRRKTGSYSNYYMDVGDLLVQALLSLLCGALVFIWLIKACVIPPGTHLVDIYKNSDYTIDESSTFEE